MDHELKPLILSAHGFKPILQSALDCQEVCQAVFNRSGEVTSGIVRQAAKEPAAQSSWPQIGG